MKRPKDRVQENCSLRPGKRRHVGSAFRNPSRRPLRQVLGLRRGQLGEAPDARHCGVQRRTPKLIAPAGVADVFDILRPHARHVPDPLFHGEADRRDHAGRDHCRRVEVHHLDWCAHRIPGYDRRPPQLVGHCYPASAHFRRGQFSHLGYGALGSDAEHQGCVAARGLQRVRATRYEVQLAQRRSAAPPLLP